MRVLHLPNNIASQADHLVAGLRACGAEARGLAPRVWVAADTTVEPLATAPRRPLVRWLLSYQARVRTIVSAIRWADVVHWHFHWGLVGALDLRLAQRLRKRMIVEFHGSDIRIPEIEAADNPYYAAVAGAHEWTMEDLATSRWRQRTFARLGAHALVACRSMEAYLQPDLFTRHYFAPLAVPVSQYQPAFPDPHRERPIVAHISTAPVLKGTQAVRAAVEAAERTTSVQYLEFDRLPHPEAIAALSRCDIFLDRFVLGSIGVAALEAMALGKPVISYVKPSMRDRYPPDLPVLSATQEDLPGVLATLLADGSLRQELGRRGRAYVAKHHDARVVAAQLLDVYEHL